MKEPANLESLVTSITDPIVANFTEIDPVKCPCGQARRGLAESGNPLCSVHVVEISKNARKHYHKNHIEIYYGLEGSGALEIDDTLQPLAPGKAILIPTGVRHKAVVQDDKPLNILNIVIPPFDPEDEHFD